MKKILQCLLILSVFFKKADSQEEFIEPAAKFLTQLPFTQLSGGIIIIHAYLDKFPDTLNFILDTGSSGISLDSTTADYFHLKPTPTDRTIRGIAGIHKVSFLFNHKLRLSALNVDSLDFHVNNYNILTEVYGERIDGIIGYAVMRRFIVMIDYDSLTVSFYSKGTLRYPRGGFLLKPTINQLAAQPLKIRDARSVSSRFLYDIGAGVCMLLSNEFTADSNFADSKRKRWHKEGQGLGGNIEMELTVIKEVRLGPYRFKNVPVLYFDDKNNVTNYPYMGGIIGNDILRRFNVILNYPAGDFYITPNSHYTESFDYSYSGIELFLIDGQIIAGEVAPGSPAEAAGIMEGDEIISVNNSFGANLNQFKIALQTPKEKVKLIYRRKGILYETEIKVKSILN